MCECVCAGSCGYISADLVLRRSRQGSAGRRSRFVALNFTVTGGPWEASQPAGKGCTCLLSQGAWASGWLDPSSSSPLLKHQLETSAQRMLGQEHPVYVLKEHVRLAGWLWGQAWWDASLLERWVPCLGVRLLGQLCVDVCT